MKQSHFFIRQRFVRKHIFVLGIFGLLVGSWFFMYYLHAQEKLILYKNEIKNLRTKQNQIFSNKKTLRDLKKSVLNLKNRLNATIHEDIKEKAIPSAKIASIARKIQKLGLTLNSCMTDEIKKRKRFTKQNVTYNISGSFEQINLLIETIAQKSRNLKCKKLLLTTAQNTRIQLELVLQFLFFKKHNDLA